MEYAAKTNLSALVEGTSQQWEEQDFPHTPFPTQNVIIMDNNVSIASEMRHKIDR